MSLLKRSGIFNKFKPSFLQKIIHKIFPLEFMLKWEIYKDLEENDCI